MISRSSSASMKKKLTTYSGLPANFLRSSGSCVAMPDRAGVQMALAHHDAADRDQRRGGDAPFFGPQHRGNGHVFGGANHAVGLHDDAAAQIVLHQHLVRFGQAQFPGRAGVLDRSLRAGAGAAVVAADQHDVRFSLGHARRDGADADFGHQLDADARLAVARFSNRGSAAPDLRSNKCRDAAAAKSDPRPACCAGCGRFP